MGFFQIRVAFVFFAVFHSGCRAENSAENPPHCLKARTFNVAWYCNSQSLKCQRTIVEDNANYTNCLTSLNVCKLLCDEYSSLWPIPTGDIFVRKTLTAIDPANIEFDIDISDGGSDLWNLFERLQDYFLRVLNYSLKAASSRNRVGLNIIIRVKDESTTVFTYAASEKYTLMIMDDGDVVDVLVEGDNYLGARHAIETLLQLIVFDDVSRSLLMPSGAYITDAPIYKHRGILLDTSRSYYPIDSIKRTLDAMAYNKLNSFHWHITDIHSFAFVSKTYPNMSAFGAYSPTEVYSWSDITEVIEYAKIRGIRVLPELDTPAHVAEGWQQFGEDVLLCFRREPWRKYCVDPPCGFLNPVSPKVYDVLRDLYKEFNDLFQSDVFHMGGDEIMYACWNETQEVIRWMERRNMSRTSENFVQLWGVFQSQAVAEFDKSFRGGAKSKIILWTSLLTKSKDVRKILNPNRFIIQIWTAGRDKQIADLLNAGYDLIISNYDALYFDCGFGRWIGEGDDWCSPYKSWQKVYMNDLQKILRDLNNTYRIETPDPQKQILGAEAALWSEVADSNCVDTRLWPRGAALAERLWSDPKTDWRAAMSRFLTQRERMAGRNIAPDLPAPLWCHQNDGLCYDHK